jgi:crotonobetainyl-CoA:carnitine CoA-transferase CaiB-like acyl-CoA transferase
MTMTVNHCTLPLSGIRVLDLGRIVAAPFATQMLADMGAEVIKIERPGEGDDSRNYGPSFLDTDNGETYSGFYLSFNRNKRSVAVNIASVEGQQLIRDLALHCDVMIENFKVGDLARKGLGYADISAVNPKIVYCSITGFGQTGPYAPYPAVDMVFQSMSGLMSVTGEAERSPQKVGLSMADVNCGLYSTIAILAALRERDYSGQGQHIDMSLLDCLISTMSHRAMDFFISGQVPVRAGNVAPGSTPAQVFNCSDGMLNVQAGTDNQFRKFCELVDRTDLLSDPRFARGRQRNLNRTALLPIFEEMFRHNTVAYWYEKLIAGGVICSPVYDLSQTLADPQVQSRGMQVSMEKESVGEIRALRNPIRYSRTPLDNYVFPPRVGEHTDEVLVSILKLSQEQIGKLHDIGAVQASF